jgi:hypothetical protein
MMMPGIAAVDSRRFLLVWTEGTSTAHQVRAITVDAGGAVIGTPKTVSSGVEGGWGRPAVTADGRGAVAFLTPTDAGFAIAATPIACPVVPSPDAAAVATSRR